MGAIVKANAITAASEATCLLLSVDETVKNPRSSQGDAQMPGAGGMGRGRGRPMWNGNPMPFFSFALSTIHARNTLINLIGWTVDICKLYSQSVSGLITT